MTHTANGLASDAASVAQFLNRDVPDDYLREWTARIAARKTAVEPGLKSVVIFRIGLEWLALPTGVFQEVVDQCAIHTLPHHRGGILSGLANVRGELLLCVALGVLLGVHKGAEVRSTRSSSRSRLMICNRTGDRLAFLVDEVHGVHRYDPKELRDGPATLAKAEAGTYVLGILPWNNRTVGCLDDELLFYALNKGLV